MRNNAMMPIGVKLALLRDALAVLDKRRHPATRAEAAAVLCETLVAEAAREHDRALLGEAVMVAADALTSGPLPAGPREAMLDSFRDALALLMGDAPEMPARRARAHRRTAMHSPSSHAMT